MRFGVRCDGCVAASANQRAFCARFTFLRTNRANRSRQLLAMPAIRAPKSKNQNAATKKSTKDGVEDHARHKKQQHKPIEQACLLSCRQSALDGFIVHGPTQRGNQHKYKCDWIGDREHRPKIWFIERSM